MEVLTQLLSTLPHLRHRPGAWMWMWKGNGGRRGLCGRRWCRRKRRLCLCWVRSRCRRLWRHETIRVGCQRCSILHRLGVSTVTWWRASPRWRERGRTREAARARGLREGPQAGAETRRSQAGRGLVYGRARARCEDGGGGRCDFAGFERCWLLILPELNVASLRSKPHTCSLLLFFFWGI